MVVLCGVRFLITVPLPLAVVAWSAAVDVLRPYLLFVLRPYFLFLLVLLLALLFSLMSCC